MLSYHYFWFVFSFAADVSEAKVQPVPVPAIRSGYKVAGATSERHSPGCAQNHASR